MTRGFHALAIALALTTLGGVSRAAAQRSHIGFHGGYNFDRDEALVGAQMHIPMTPRVEFYPSFDYFFTEPGTLLAFNADLKFRTPGAPLQLYLGGGLSVLRQSASGVSDTHTGGNVFGGLETRLGASHPYVEGRVLLHDRSSFQLLGGINITLF